MRQSIYFFNRLSRMVVILEDFGFPDVFVQSIIGLHDWHR